MSNYTVDDFIKMREDGMSYKEIADIAGCSRQNVQERIKRDRERVKYYAEIIKGNESNLNGLLHHYFKNVREFSDVMGIKYARAGKIANGELKPTVSEMFKMCDLFSIDSLSLARKIFDN